MNINAQDNRIQTGALWTRNYVLLILVNVLSAFSFNMVSTILSKYLVSLGTALTFAGVIVGAFSITALVIRPFSGMVSDKYDKRKILFVSNLLIAAGVLGYTFTHTVWLIFAFRILHGIGFGISGTASIALASEIIPRERTGEGIGYVGLGQILAVAVAPGLGIAISGSLSYNAAFYCSCLMALASALLLVWFKAEPKAKPVTPGKLLHSISLGSLIAKDALLFSIISGVMSLNNGIVNAYILLYSDQLHIGSISIYFMVTAAVMLVIRPLSGKLMDKRGLQVLLYPAFAIGVLGMILHGVSTSLWMLLLAGALKAVASAAIQASLLADCIRRAGPGRSGVATSTFYIGADIGQGIGPVIGGFIASLMGYSVMFYFCAAMTLAGGLMFVTYSLAERGKRRADIAPDTGSAY